MTLTECPSLIRTPKLMQPFTVIDHFYLQYFSILALSLTFSEALRAFSEARNMPGRPFFIMEFNFLWNFYAHEVFPFPPNPLRALRHYNIVHHHSYIPFQQKVCTAMRRMVYQCPPNLYYSSCQLALMFSPHNVKWSMKEIANMR